MLLKNQNSFFTHQVIEKEVNNRCHSHQSLIFLIFFPKKTIIPGLLSGEQKTPCLTKVCFVRDSDQAAPTSEELRNS